MLVECLQSLRETESQSSQLARWHAACCASLEFYAFLKRTAILIHRVAECTKSIIKSRNVWLSLTGVHLFKTVLKSKQRRRMWLNGASRTSLISVLLRGVQIAIVALIIVWVALLGGVRFTPTPQGDGNDTGLLFNWHPLLMTLAFVVCMGEAVLAYKAPLLKLPDRPARKAWHVAMHTSALVLGSLGITAAIQSHTLKRPKPIPNFYSTHSFLGLLVCFIVIGQGSLGILAFIAPKWSVQTRQEFGPIHAFSGLFVLITGIATMGVSWSPSEFNFVFNTLKHCHSMFYPGRNSREDNLCPVHLCTWS